MRKRFCKCLIFLLLLMPMYVNAADYMFCGSNRRIPFVLGEIVSVFFVIIRILVPILLIITGIISFFKATLSSKVDEELQKAKKSFINKIIASVIIFFVFSIVNTVISLVAGRDNSFSSCLYCMIHPKSCANDNADIARLCPGLLTQQADYDNNCIYQGEQKSITNYGDTGETGVPSYSVPTQTNSGGYTNPTVVPNTGTNTNTSEDCFINNDVRATKIDVKKTNGVTYMNGIIIVNKSYSLPESYIPDNAGSNNLTTDTNNAFTEMFKAARNDGISLEIVSGFRSYSVQKSLYQKYVDRDGKDAADTYSARPGHSEHESGLAFDVNTAGREFNGTVEAKWINDNCYKFGFIVRYPQGKQCVTGYTYESWHLRYVGKELAETLYNNGSWVSLEEYFNITSEYKN